MTAFAIVGGALVFFFVGFMVGEINAMRREARHQENLRCIRNGLPLTYP